MREALHPVASRVNRAVDAFSRLFLATTDEASSFRPQQPSRHPVGDNDRGTAALFPAWFRPARESSRVSFAS